MGMFAYIGDSVFKTEKEEQYEREYQDKSRCCSEEKTNGRIAQT